jgi:hypothetical protein
MKTYGLILAALALSVPALANDGGIASLKVQEIKMREYALKDGDRKEVKRIANPDFTIFVNGAEANKLQKILPPTRSVFTAMYPKLAKEYNETFKSLGIYSDATKDGSGKTLVTSKVITISCDDGEIQGLDNNNPRIVKRGSTRCQVQINAVPEGTYPEDYLGDTDSFDPAEVCR